MKKKKILIALVILVFVLGLVFHNHLIRFYVSLRPASLENYAAQLLNEGAQTEDRYGLWKTSCYPGDGMVEFHTGGWGLAPSATYTGFYYSADNSHKLFSAAYPEETTMQIDGDRAQWCDGTDNQGISIRITENWFWFEASF